MDWQYFGRNVAKIANVWATQQLPSLFYSVFLFEKKKKLPSIERRKDTRAVDKKSTVDR